MIFQHFEAPPSTGGMNRQRLSATLAVVIAAVAGQQWWQFNSWDRGFHQLTVGMSEKEVLSIMGKPSAAYHETAPTEPTWDGDSVNHRLGNAVEKWYYNLPLAMYKSWAVGFNEQGQLVARWEPVSP